MFIGHFAAGLAAKKAAPAVSLGILFLAVQFADLLWPTLLLAGVEQVQIVPGAKPIPLIFTHYPISHSLLMGVVWGILIGGIYWLVRRDRRAALVVGLCVLSHWVLDLFVHVPDLPLYPGSSVLLGFGLWNQTILELVIELLMFGLGIYLYLGATKAKNKIGSIGFWALMVFLLGIHVANIFGPPPPDVKAIAWAGQLQWLFVIWAFWVDRNREALTA
ncbi:MAG TPA: hypothetical protein PKE06_27055 [Flavilitoribacter sp.]|nr:hypothetical protein [Flavilitoribacter sp.]HMQ89613.1 hypothetical protein [Flavilitoribacter sp.]